MHTAEKEVLLDVTRLFGRVMKDVIPTGVDRVTLAYVKHYYSSARAVLSEGRYVAVLTKKDSKQAFDALLHPSSKSKSILKSLIVKARLSAWYPKKIHEAVLINTGHNGIENQNYALSLRKRGVKLLFMIHDAIPITHPEFCRPNEKPKHQKRVANILTKGSGVIANSVFTLEAIKQEANKISVKMPISTVSHLAPGFILRHSDTSPFQKPYFVVLGTIEPRKNHHLLFRVWRKLVEEIGERAPRLVVVGRRGWECENVVDVLERSEALRGYLIEKNTCSDDELCSILSHAQALLFPSLVEGYGMPIVESLMVSTPVIATNLSVFHEIAGDIPDYLDPLDGLGWLDHIKAYMDSNHPLRLAQLERMQHFELPTWQSHFEKVDALIHEVTKTD